MSDQQLTIPLLTASVTPTLPGVQKFLGASDGSGNVVMQSIPRINGAQVSSANPMPVASAATSLVNSASGTMTTAVSIIVPFSATRQWLMITNRTTGTEVQDIGSSNVTVGGGIPLAPGGGFLFDGPGAAGPIYGIAGVSGSPFSYVEG